MVPVIAAVFSLLLEYGVVQRLFGGEQDEDPSFDGPSHPWETKGTSADTKGVHASGEVWPQGDGGIYVTGTLVDTKRDGFPVKITMEALDSDGRVTPAITINSSGENHAVSLGVGGPNADPKTSGRLFQGPIKAVRVNECVLDRDEHNRQYDKKCGRATVIWTAP